MSTLDRDSFRLPHPVTALLAPIRFQQQYIWLLYLSTIDVVLTWLILALGGWEVNPLAGLILSAGGFSAMVGFKFAMVGLFIGMCEYVGRRGEAMGNQLAWVGVALAVLPVAVALSQLVVAYG